jgi:hypothetical protein
MMTAGKRGISAPVPKGLAVCFGNKHDHIGKNVLLGERIIFQVLSFPKGKSAGHIFSGRKIYKTLLKVMTLYELVTGATAA